MKITTEYLIKCDKSDPLDQTHILMAKRDDPPGRWSVLVKPHAGCEMQIDLFKALTAALVEAVLRDPEGRCLTA